MSNKIN